MAVSVPRSADAHVPGLERARGVSAARAREASARADGLSDARSTALRAIETAEGLAEWCALAAANLDESSKVLLELFGQGAKGPCRSRAWIMRNGARIRKGERGYAVSRWGGYVWNVRQSTGNFGTVGNVEAGPVPADDLAGWTDLAGGDAVAGAILAAMRGWAVGAVKADTVDLDRSLAAARAVAYAWPACLSCEGAGCLACSCADDRSSRVVVLSWNDLHPEPEPTVKAAPRIGRPPKTRPALPELVAVMAEVADKRDEADGLRDEARRLEVAAMRRAVKAGATQRDIAAAVGISQARVKQILDAD